MKLQDAILKARTLALMCESISGVKVRWLKLYVLDYDLKQKDFIVFANYDQNAFSYTKGMFDEDIYMHSAKLPFRLLLSNEWEASINVELRGNTQEVLKELQKRELDLRLKNANNEMHLSLRDIELKGVANG